MANKAQKRKHVSPESLILVSILNDLFVNSQRFDRYLRASAFGGREYSTNNPNNSNGPWETPNSDVSSLIGSLKFARVGSFNSRTNDTAPLTNDLDANDVETLGTTSNVHLQNSTQLQEDTRKLNSVTLSTRVGFDVGHLLKSALAGGISCAFSAFNASSGHCQETSSSINNIVLSRNTVKDSRDWCSRFIQGLYTCGCWSICKVQSITSFLGTVLGTTMRIPCEVLKQLLQANLFDNIVEATVSTWHQDGLKGLFRGTGVTLLREVPFYVAGMGLYNESKKVVERQLGRELEPWEAIAVGALYGGFTAVLKTPFDVIKTRMMTAPQGPDLSMWNAAYSILTQEGPLAFYKGAVPRFFWTAPLGALNLAGYELLQKAMITPLNESVHSE